MDNKLRRWIEDIKKVNAAAAETVYSDEVDEAFIYYLSTISIIHDNAADVNFIIGSESGGIKQPVVNETVTTGAQYVEMIWLGFTLKPGDRVYIDIPAMTAGKYARFILRGYKIDARAFAEGLVSVMVI